MENYGWRYYNHALIPTCAPHELPNVEALGEKSLWAHRRPLFACWTTDFDKCDKTGWWYCICDKPFDFEGLKSKRKNIIKNGIKYCEVRICNPLDFEDDLREIFNEVQLNYLTGKISDKESYHKYLQKLCEDSGIRFFVCFLRENGAVAGYAIVKDFGTYSEYQVQKAKPEYEKYQTNAALACAVVEHFKDRLSGNFYICDGARNINHTTNFQQYLEKYFGFRKAYCLLHIRYRKGLKAIIRFLFLFRRLLLKFDGIKGVHQLNGVLKMEACRRQKNE